MNALDDLTLNELGFSFLDLVGRLNWTVWTPTYSFATATSLTVVGRHLVVGKLCFWQVQSSGTSIATTAGTSFIDLPIPSKGFSGMSQMFNLTANTGVAGGGINAANRKYYPPTQGASANTFSFTGSYEV